MSIENQQPNNDQRLPGEVIMDELIDEADTVNDLEKKLLEEAKKK